MKKILSTGVIMAAAFLAGCSMPKNISFASDTYEPFMFNKTYNRDEYGIEVLVDKDTKVEYMLIEKSNSHGKGLSITPRYNADGTLKISE